jgi:hypothetical protein
MRDFKGMKRQRGRNRGPGGGGNGGGKQHNANRAFDSNGPEGIKVRGAAQGVYEKYLQLARDAGTGGDRVLAENYLQHAEHYYRVLRTMQPQRPVSEIIGRDAFSSGFDIDFEAEPELPAEAPADAEGEGAQGEGEGGQPREERQRDDRPRYNDRDRSRDDRPRYNDRQRDDRQRDDRQRDDRPREDRPRYNDRPRDERPRDDRPREERQREDRAPREERAPRGERNERVSDAPLLEAAQPAPRDGARLRGQDGAVSEAPAFLSRGAPAPAPAAETPAPAAEEAPKKRGRPRKAAAPVEDA